MDFGFLELVIEESEDDSSLPCPAGPDQEENMLILDVICGLLCIFDERIHQKDVEDVQFILERAPQSIHIHESLDRYLFIH
jgi:hypothetical protein